MMIMMTVMKEVMHVKSKSKGPKVQNLVDGTATLHIAKLPVVVVVVFDKGAGEGVEVWMLSAERTLFHRHCRSLVMG